MPSSRRSVATKTRRAGELTSLPAISISPASGRSNPATQRKRRRLAATARPEQDTKLALGDFQVDGSQGIDAPLLRVERFLQSTDANHWSSLRSELPITHGKFQSFELPSPLICPLESGIAQRERYAASPISPMRDRIKRTAPTTIAAKRIKITPSAATCGTQPLPQNCHTTVDITTLLRV